MNPLVKIALWSTAGVLAVLGIVYALVLAHREQKAWESWCRDAGGVVSSSTKTHVATGFVNGKPVTTTSSSTTYYCVADGKLLGIREN